MKKINSYIFLIFVALLFICFQIVNGQEYKEDFTREIEVKNTDSIVKTYILVSGKAISPDKPVLYYWYYDNKIHFNQSGIAGFPLHGKYLVFDRNGKLTCSGFFQNGLKDGEWKYWFNNGNIKRLEKYKLGLLKGLPSNYDENGDIIITKKSHSNFFEFFRKKKNDQDSSRDKIHEKPLQDSTIKTDPQPKR
jgi:antitoxin component YwqK of YwqJK toxin-antitoxin module